MPSGSASLGSPRSLPLSARPGIRPARQGRYRFCTLFGKRSDQPRTAEDRARAAAERAARREGRPLPPEAFQDTIRPADIAPAPSAA